MPTNDRKIRIYNKRLLSLSGIRDNFLEFLDDEIDEIVAAIFQSTSGVLDPDTIELVAGSTNSQFTLGLSNANRVVVGTGQIIDLSLITGTDITEDIFFEDDGSSVYYVGIKFAEVEDGIELNPRTGDPEYPNLKQTYGEVDTPDSVTDNTTYIRIIINSITESGVDHTGRTVRVWLVDPVSGVESLAYFEGTSAYSAPNNYVDVPYSGADGPLGQDTSSSPPSTTASDYKVFIEGASWKKNTDLRTTSAYAFIGQITSTGGVPVFSIADQNNIFINTLDRAYDGASGSGSGRRINVDAGSVHLRSPSGGSTTGDTHNAQLQLDKLDSTDWMQIMSEYLIGDSSGIPIAVLEPIAATTYLWLAEAATQSGTRTVDFDRVGVDLTHVSVRLTKRLHFLMLENSDQAALYLINSFTASSVDVSDLQTGIAPSLWTTGSGRTARILTVKLWVGGETPDPASQMDLLRGTTFVGSSGARQNLTLRFLPDGNTGKFIIFYDNGVPDGTTDLPREAYNFEPDNVGLDDEEVFRHLRPTLLSSGDTTGGKQPAYHTKSAVVLQGGGSDGAQLAEPGMACKIVDDNDIYLAGISSQGRFYRGHELHDDMNYHPSRVTSPATLPPEYALVDIAGTGNALAVHGNAGGVDLGHGCLQIQCGANNLDRSVLRTARFMNSKALSGLAWGFQWVIDVKFKFIFGVTNAVYNIGLEQYDYGAFNKMYIYLKFDSSTDTYFSMLWGEDDASVGSQVTAITPTNDRWYWLRLAMVGTRFWYWSLGSRTDTVESGVEDIGFAGGGGAETNFLNNLGVWEFYADVMTRTTAARGIILDHLHCLDGGMPMQNSKLGNED